MEEPNLPYETAVELRLKRRDTKSIDIYGVPDYKWFAEFYLNVIIGVKMERFLTDKG